MSNNRDREKELRDVIGRKPHVELVMELRELLELRLSRYKDGLIATNDDLMRGRAMECRDLLEKILPSKS